MSHPPDPMEQRFNRIQRSHRIEVAVGVVSLSLGYMLLAVPPETPQEWVLIRVAFGMLLVLLGFWLAVLPLLSRLLGTEDKEE